ncbi:MAG: hypothetical protein WAP35_09260 [Solirubrobacterales bacterium]
MPDIFGIDLAQPGWYTAALGTASAVTQAVAAAGRPRDTTVEQFQFFR